MKTVIRSAAWKIFSYLVVWRVMPVLLAIYEQAIRQILPDGSLVRPRPAKLGELSVLALSAEQYRDDPMFLAKAQNVRVLVLPQRWQTRLIMQFYSSGYHWHQYMNPEAGSDVADSKEKLRSFFRAFLPRLYERLGVDCVIAPHIHYYPDADWGAVSNELGFPFVVFQRENMALSEWLRELVTWRIRHMGQFEGSKIIVHNKAMQSLYQDAGIAGRAEILSLGCIRMDGFIERVRRTLPPENLRKKVVFFPFYISRTFDERIRPFFDSVHVSLTRFALQHPEFDILIKPKPKFEKAWREDFDQALSHAGLEAEIPTNLTIDSGGDAQDLIMTADVVSGLQTTTLLEAALFGRPVVIPFYGEADTPEFISRLMFQESFGSFAVARSGEDLIRKLGGAATSRGGVAVDRTQIDSLFSSVVSDLNGGATDRYVDALKASVQDCSQLRFEGRATA